MSQRPERTTEARRANATAGYMSRPHYNPIWIDPIFLEESGIRDDVTRMLTTSGWRGLLTFASEADKEDTSKFLGSFQYIGCEDHQGFEYNHRGERYRCTMRELREIFHWPANGRIYLPFQGQWYPAWNELATEAYSPGAASPKSFTDPAIFYLHQILSKTIFARKNSDKVGQLELAVLYMLKTGQRIHWGHYFCKHIENMRANSPVCCGGMITHILRIQHETFEDVGHTILPPTYADRIWFQHGQHIQVTHDDEIQWRYFRDVALRPPPVVPRPRGRPPTRGRGRGARGHALEHDPPQQQPHPQYYQQGPAADPIDQLAQMQVDYIFNSTRASILAGRQFAIQPAPPGWRPGHPIPPEYL